MGDEEGCRDGDGIHVHVRTGQYVLSIYTFSTLMTRRSCTGADLFVRDSGYTCIFSWYMCITGLLLQRCASEYGCMMF